MFKIALMNLLRHKARTALALLGIVIGVMAIVGMVSVVDGLLADFEEAFGKIQGKLYRGRDCGNCFHYRLV